MALNSFASENEAPKEKVLKIKADIKTEKKIEKGNNKSEIKQEEKAKGKEKPIVKKDEKHEPKAKTIKNDKPIKVKKDLKTHKSKKVKLPFSPVEELELPLLIDKELLRIQIAEKQATEAVQAVSEALHRAMEEYQIHEETLPIFQQNNDNQFKVKATQQ